MSGALVRSADGHPDLALGLDNLAEALAMAVGQADPDVGARLRQRDAEWRAVKTMNLELVHVVPTGELEAAAAHFMTRQLN